MAVEKEMTSEQFKNRVKEVMTQELKQPEVTLWLSFADKGFRGAIICQAHGISDALMKCNLLGINPGGEVIAREIPEDLVKTMLEKEDFWRLITKEEIKRRWGIKSLKEQEDEEQA